jgi:hypothetical protein
MTQGTRFFQYSGKYEIIDERQRKYAHVSLILPRYVKQHLSTVVH